jgi:putative transposase
MKKRIHSSLSYLTPDEYERTWNQQKKKNDSIEGELA